MSRSQLVMDDILLPILLFLAAATGLAIGMVVIGSLLGPKRTSRVKEMPYESGMDPIHDARRRFDVRFHLVAIAFLIFDVELLFLYPWAVAKSHEAGLPAVLGDMGSVTVVFCEVLVFLFLLALGFVYAWRKGVFQWR
ncbi:MAG: NADH-quinone oxidoreductase subunit A [Pirellulaceae bacterium]|nr:NADH-quinone oxidoreductase subunit A [Pirellulaceae bacterium]